MHFLRLVRRSLPDRSDRTEAESRQRRQKDLDGVPLLRGRVRDRAEHRQANDKVLWVDDDPNNQSSLGKLCVKGRFGVTFVNHGDRLTTPLIRKNGKLTPASWDEALDLTAEKLVEHRGATAALASAKATNEDGYILQKFMRMAMGTNSIDHCTRLCHSPSVEAMLRSLGSGATSNSYLDYEKAGLPDYRRV